MVKKPRSVLNAAPLLLSELKHGEEEGRERGKSVEVKTHHFGRHHRRRLAPLFFADVCERGSNFALLG